MSPRVAVSDAGAPGVVAVAGAPVMAIWGISLREGGLDHVFPVSIRDTRSPILQPTALPGSSAMDSVVRRKIWPGPDALITTIQ